MFDSRHVAADALAKTATLLQTRCYRELIDFDNHLDDIEQDWLNLELNEKIDHAL